MSETLSSALAGELLTSIPTSRELKKALPGASSDFILGQLEAEASIEEAIGAYLAVVAKENEELKAETASLTEKLAALEKDAGKPAAKSAGNQPLADLDAAGNTAVSLEAAEEFAAKVDECLAKKMTRQKAVSTVARKHPDLHAAFVATANSR